MPAKTDRAPSNAADSTATLTEAAETNAPAARRRPLPTPALGSVIGVKVASGAVLINNETGVRFQEDKETPQTVSLTTLRRLEDGDLLRVS